MPQSNAPSTLKGPIFRYADMVKVHRHLGAICHESAVGHVHETRTMEEARGGAQRRAVYTRLLIPVSLLPAGVVGLGEMTNDGIHYS